MCDWSWIDGKAEDQAVKAAISGIDSNGDRMAAVAKEYAIGCCASLDEIRTAMDCAFVCTSPKSHGPIINACLEKGCHVFSEINLLSDL